MPKRQRRRPNARKRGRPTVFNRHLANRLCRRISEGESLRAICSNPTFPSKSTVLRWLSKHDGFWDQYARARVVQADTLMDEAIDLARSAMGYIDVDLRRKIDTLKWAAAKLNPKVYGKLKAKDEDQLKGEEAECAESDEEDCDDIWLTRPKHQFR